jgi:hypothetical protein
MTGSSASQLSTPFSLVGETADNQFHLGVWYTKSTALHPDLRVNLTSVGRQFSRQLPSQSAASVGAETGICLIKLVLRSSRKIQGIGLRPTRPAVSSRLGVNHLSVSEH